jgi:Tfp pilus assembly protein PilE
MRKHDSKWKTLIPLIVAIVVMTGVFILISYLSYRQNEIEDLENYAR